MHSKFCDGSMSKLEKLELLKEFFSQGNATSGGMMKDRKYVTSSNTLHLLMYSSFYLLLGTGYSLLLNMFVKAPSAFYILPAATCGVMGYYKYYELLNEKARVADKYEYEMFKKYCKKPLINK